MDDPVQKPSLNPVDPFALPQRNSPPVPPRPGQPFPPASDKPAGTDLRFVPSPTPTAPTVPTPAPRPMTPPPTPFSTPAPTPIAPAPRPGGQASPQNDQYTSSIRTMSEDIAKIKSGQQPMGVDTQKTLQPSAPAAPAPIPAPVVRPSVPQGPGIQTNIGLSERSRGMDTTKAPTSTSSFIPSTPPRPAMTVPPPASGSHGRLYALIILGAILVGGLYWFLSRNNGDVAQNTPTPTVTARPTVVATPTPKTLAMLLGGTTEPITLASTGDPSTDFWAKINALTLFGGEFRRLFVTADTKASGELTPLELMDRFIISSPLELKNLLSGETAIIAYGQKESFDAKGVSVPSAPVKKRLILISETNNALALAPVMKTWESTMTNALATLLKYTKTKPASSAFLDNIYQNVPIRYRNFTQADSTIDYGIVPASNGKTYLVISNSREAMFATIDKLR